MEKEGSRGLERFRLAIPKLASEELNDLAWDWEEWEDGH